MSINDDDKTKIRTATKCYLIQNRKATAKQIHSYLMKLDLKLRGDITINELARELTYCSKTKNFVNLTFEIRERDNTRFYKIKED